MSKSVRVTISIPSDLKVRMDAVEEPTNWSAVAARAFEDRVADITAKKGAKSMDDAIARLRASKRKTSDSDQQAGHDEGREWAMNRAEAVELERLARAADGRDWDLVYDFDGHSAFGPTERVFRVIAGDEVGNLRRDAAMFWEEAGFNLRDGAEVERTESEISAFVRGFVEGAVEVWDEVKDQL